MNPIKYLRDACDAALKAARRYDNHAVTLGAARDTAAANGVLLHLLDWEHAHLRYFNDGDIARVHWSRADGNAYGISSDISRSMPGWHYGNVADYADAPPQGWLDYVKGKG